MNKQLTAIIEREGDVHDALSPEADVGSQRNTVAEAFDLFFEIASKKEIDRRMRNDVHVTHVEVALG